MDKDDIPARVRSKLRRQARDKRIRSLYDNGKGFSMDEIAVKEKCSKTTVFFAINGRSSRRRKTPNLKKQH